MLSSQHLLLENGRFCPLAFNTIQVRLESSKCSLKSYTLREQNVLPIAPAADCAESPPVEPCIKDMELTPDPATNQTKAYVIEAGSLLRNQLVRDLEEMPEISEVDSSGSLEEAVQVLDSQTAPLVVVNVEQIRRTEWPSYEELKRRTPDSRIIGFTTLANESAVGQKAGRFCEAIVPLAINPQALITSIARVATAREDANEG